MAKRKSKGLGDTIEAITEVTGIKKVVEVFSSATGLDCGCDERKDKLNKLFPYNRNINCLTEQDYNSLTIILKRNQLTPNDQLIVANIYFNVFKQKLELSNCSSCWIGKIEELKKVYNEYNVNEI